MPISAPPAPVQKKTPATPKPRTPTAAAEQTEQRLSGRAEAVNGIFQIGTAICILTKQYADAATIDEHGENISIEAAKIAEDNEKFANVLDKLASAGPYAGLLAAVLPMAMQLAVNHKRIEPGAMGTIDPEALEAKIKADIAEKKAKVMQEARVAQDRAAQAQAALTRVA